MLVSLIPVSSILLQKASAISPAAMYEGSDVYHDNDGHRPASALKAGEVWTDKHVIKDANIAQNYQFDIILKALAGKNETEDVTQYDIIFLLDVSQSMDGYIDDLEGAANDAIEAALSGNTDDVFNRVAVITFGRGADIHKFSGQTWLSALGTNSPISNLKKASQQGTNMQAALYEAYKLLNNENQVRGDATPVIILMSDGAPNCYAKKTSSRTPRTI
jgi:Mg-chelatase subunit ChlD